MRIVAWVNLFGVLALAALCSVQWGVNRRVNLLAVRLDKTRQEQARKISEQVETLAGCMADLDDFRERVKRLNAALENAETQIASLRAERDRMGGEHRKAVAERDQLLAERERTQALLAKWIAAVGERDVALKKANDEIVSLRETRNDAVSKFNDLAIKYNAMVKEMNETRARPPTGK